MPVSNIIFLPNENKKVASSATATASTLRERQDSVGWMEMKELRRKTHGVVFAG